MVNILYSQHRISTRGADKGVKEDFKLAMKRRVARSIEPLDNLIIKFLTSERDLLLQSVE
jgi:integrator complex subunit 10